MQGARYKLTTPKFTSQGSADVGQRNVNHGTISIKVRDGQWTVYDEHRRQLIAVAKICNPYIMPPRNGWMRIEHDGQPIPMIGWTLNCETMEERERERPSTREELEDRAMLNL